MNGRTAGSFKLLGALGDGLGNATAFWFVKENIFRPARVLKLLQEITGGLAHQHREVPPCTLGGGFGLAVHPFREADADAFGTAVERIFLPANLGDDFVDLAHRQLIQAICFGVRPEGGQRSQQFGPIVSG